MASEWPEEDRFALRIHAGRRTTSQKNSAIPPRSPVRAPGKTQVRSEQLKDRLQMVSDCVQHSHLRLESYLNDIPRRAIYQWTREFQCQYVVFVNKLFPSLLASIITLLLGRNSSLAAFALWHISWSLSVGRSRYVFQRQLSRSHH